MLPASRPSPRSWILVLWLASAAACAHASDGPAVDRISLQRVQRESPQGLWVRGTSLSPQARELLAELRGVEQYGLSAADYAPLLADVDAAEASFDVPRLENSLSLAGLRLMRELHDGRVDARAAGYELQRRRAPVDFAALLAMLATSEDVHATLAALEPRSAQYHALKQALARYRRISESFVPAPSARAGAIRPGDAYAGAAALRRRLAELGDFQAQETPAPLDGIYDAGLAAAIAHFQRRHGLEPDGMLGTRTRQALAVPMSQRVRQIELTLERWRWLPDLHPPAVIVNLPQYMLYLLPDPADADAATQIRKIPVIVGKQRRQTPVFDSAIEAVVFRPYWDVPSDITRQELLPLIARDPGYLARHEMEIVRGPGDAAPVLPADQAAIAELRAGRARLRQRPGEQNALGLIKFVLPNPYAIYLHSTPEASLFGRDRRDLSHGCVRVSDTTALALYLLKQTPGDWNADAIELATCATAPTTRVQLARPVPVFILYGTVVADRDDLMFFDDIYGYDARLEALLTRTASDLPARAAR